MFFSPDILKQGVTPQESFVLMKTSRKPLEDVFHLRIQKTSSRLLDQDHIFALAKDLFKTSSKRLQDDLLKRLQVTLKTSLRHFQDVLQRYLQDAFKTYHQVKLFLLTRFQDIFETYCNNGYLQKDLPRSHF